MQVCSSGAQDVVFNPDLGAHLIEKTQRLGIFGAVDKGRDRPGKVSRAHVVFHAGFRSFSVVYIYEQYFKSTAYASPRQLRRHSVAFYPDISVGYLTLGAKNWKPCAVITAWR